MAMIDGETQIAMELLAIEQRILLSEPDPELEIQRRDLFEALFQTRNFPWLRRAARIPVNLTARLIDATNAQFEIVEISCLNLTAKGRAFKNAREGQRLIVELDLKQGTPGRLQLEFIVRRFRAFDTEPGVGMEISEENSKVDRAAFVNQVYYPNYVDLLRRIASGEASVANIIRGNNSTD